MPTTLTSGLVLRDTTISGATVEGLLEGVELTDCVLEGCVLDGTEWRGCALRRVTLRGCSLSNSRWEQCGCHDLTLDNCRALGVDWTRSRLAMLTGTLRCHDSKLDYSSFGGLALTGAEFLRCSLIDVKLSDAGLAGADFAGSDLTGANLAGASLREASLVGATGYRLDPTYTSVSGLRASLPEAVTMLLALGVVIEEPPPPSW